MIRDTIDSYKDAVPGSPEGRLIRKMDGIYRQLQEAFAEGVMDAGENFQKAKDNIANGGDLRYSKSAKVFFDENAFPPYNKSQSDAHEWAERWARSESAQIQNKKLVSYHNRWYLIQAFDDMKYGYQIIERIKVKDYDKVAKYYGILTGYESIQDTSGQNAALLRKARESGGIGHRSNSHAAQHRGENSEIYGMGTTQNGRRETDSNSGRNSGSGGEDSRRQEGSSLTDSDGNQLSAAQQAYFTESKERDTNGNLQVMYRGDSEEVTVYDRKKSKTSNLYGRGFYYTSEKSQAGQYGIVRAFYLNTVDPLMPGQHNIYWIPPQTPQEARQALNFRAYRLSYSPSVGVGNPPGWVEIPAFLKKALLKKFFLLFS